MCLYCFTYKHTEESKSYASIKFLRLHIFPSKLYYSSIFLECRNSKKHAQCDLCMTNNLSTFSHFSHRQDITKV